MTAELGDNHPRVSEFSELRQGCEALKEIFVPDGTWDSFQAAARRRRDGVPHASVLLLAAERGYLGALTGPVHRFILGDFAEGRVLDPDYAQELRELWMLPQRDADRHSEGRRYRGKLTELQVASYLETVGWEICDLAALVSQSADPRPDVRAMSPDESCCSVEVKFIGLSNEGFAGRSSDRGYWVDVKDRINVFLGRVYHAATQLRSLPGAHVACVALSNDAWELEYKAELLDSAYIDWACPEFLECHAESGWHVRHSQLLGKHPSIDADLADVIGTLDAVMVLHFDHEFGVHEIMFRQLSAA